MFLAGDPHLDELVWLADNLVGNHLLLILDLAGAPTDESLYRENRPRWIDDRLTTCCPADKGPSLGSEGYDRGGQSAPLRIGDDGHIAALHHRDDAVGGPQVDANDLLAFSH